MKTEEKTPDGRLVAEANEAETLYLLARFGWLTSRQVAALIWPSSPSASALRMAQRTLKRLIEDQMIVERSLPQGIPCYVLGRRGAERARHDYVHATRGTDQGLGNPAHRALSNWYAIHAWLHDASVEDVWTEYEIQRGLAPVKNIQRKTPDALLVLNPDHAEQLGGNLVWVEIENTHKNRKRREAMLQFGLDRFSDPGRASHAVGDGDDYLAAMRIVCRNQERGLAVLNSAKALHENGALYEQHHARAWYQVQIVLAEMTPSLSLTKAWTPSKVPSLGHWLKA